MYRRLVDHFSRPQPAALLRVPWSPHRDQSPHLIIGIYGKNLPDVLLATSTMAHRCPIEIYDLSTLPPSFVLRPPPSASANTVTSSLRAFNSFDRSEARERCTNDYWQTINENLDTTRCRISTLGWVTKIIPRLTSQRAQRSVDGMGRSGKNPEQF